MRLLLLSRFKKKMCLPSPPPLSNERERVLMGLPINSFTSSAHHFCLREISLSVIVLHKLRGVVCTTKSELTQEIPTSISYCLRVSTADFAPTKLTLSSSATSCTLLPLTMKLPALLSKETWIITNTDGNEKWIVVVRRFWMLDWRGMLRVRIHPKKHHLADQQRTYSLTRPPLLLTYFVWVASMVSTQVSGVF